MTAINDLSTLRVLLVDDQQFILSTTGLLLREKGISTVHKARSLREAIRVLNNASVDLVITDLEMDKGSGLELVKAIRCSDTRASNKLPVFVLTTHAHSHVVCLARKFDIDGFMGKPINMKILLEKVRSLASRSDDKIQSKENYLSVSTDIHSTSSQKQPDFTALPRLIPVSELKQSMILADDLRLISGTVVFKRNTRITDFVIEKIVSLARHISVQKIKIMPLLHDVESSSI